MSSTSSVAGSGTPGRKPVTFIEHLHLRRTGRDKSFRPGDKLQVYKLVRGLGFPMPEILRVFETIAEIDLHGLPDAFALKANNLASTRGVHVLNRVEGTNAFWDQLKRRSYTEEELRAEYEHWRNGLQERGRVEPLHVLAEEIVVQANAGAGIPLDYKAYAFNGEIRLILQIDRNTSPTSITFYDRTFAPWDWSAQIALNPKLAQPGAPMPPPDAQTVLDTASRLSRALNTPFVSIDMYASTRGVLVGELTAAPGGPYYGMFKFSPAFDLDLGACWRRAAAELGQSVNGWIGEDERIPRPLKKMRPPAA